MTVHPVDEEGRLIPDASWPPGREAPGRLERVRRYLNSWNRESGADHLGEPVRAGRWLRGEGWPLRPDEQQLDELRRFRVDLHNVVAALSRGATPAWPAATTSAALAIDVTGDGPVLVGSGGGADRVISDLLAILVEARADGSLGRLRVCANDHCQWSYYDRSKNGGGTWCSMDVCGQRQKMRRYRARQRTATRRGARRPVRAPTSHRGGSAARSLGGECRRP